MSRTGIEMKGNDKVRKFLIHFPKKLDRQLSKTNLRFMENVRDLAKQIVPVDTRSLKEAIKLAPVRKGKNVKVWKISVNNRAAAPQEFGFKPHKFLVDPGRPEFQTKKLRKFYGQVITVRKNTPFLEPALRENIQVLSPKINSAIRRAIIR